MKVRGTVLVGSIVTLAAASSGCLRLPYIPYVTSPPPAAVARLLDAKGQVVGTAVLSQESPGMRILLDVAGLPPGDKAVHIHEVGRCEAPSFESAGAHFNPTRAAHGAHAGDLPDVTVNADGKGHMETTAKGLTLDRKAPASLLGGSGSALVIHDSADDKRTDPDGNSGARIACGVIAGEGKR